MRILLVDGNEDASTSMAELRTLCAHDVRTAGDGAKALQGLHSSRRNWSCPISMPNPN